MALRLIDIADGFSSESLPSDVPLPDGASTEETQALILAELLLKAKVTDTQPVSVSSLPLPSGAATQTTLAGVLAELLLKAKVTDTQPVSIAGTIPTSQGSLSGTIATAQKSVGLTAVRASVSGSALTSTLKKRRMKPSTSNTGRIWYGGAAVTISTGIEIVGPDIVILDSDFSDYYIISDTASQVVELIEVA